MMVKDGDQAAEWMATGWGHGEWMDHCGMLCG